MRWPQSAGGVRCLRTNRGRGAEAAERAQLTSGRVDPVFRDGDELVVGNTTDTHVTEKTAVQ